MKQSNKNTIKCMVLYQVGTNIMFDFLDKCFPPHLFKYCFLFKNDK